MIRKLIFSAAALALAAGPVFSQGYPNKVIKLQAPFAPRGATDIIARVIAEPLGRALGQPVIGARACLTRRPAQAPKKSS